MLKYRLLNRYALVFFLALCFIPLRGISADLDLDPVHLFKCWRALRKINTGPPPFFSTKLQPKDIEQAQENTWGGLVYRAVDGSPVVLFWPLKSKETQHREAVIGVLESELKAVKEYLENPGNAKLTLLTDIQENLSHLLSDLKSGAKISEAISDRFLGFLVHTDKTAESSKRKIKSVDFDLNLIGSSKNRVLFGWIDEVQILLNSISKSISPKLKPEIYRVNSLFLDSYLGPDALKAPTGARLEVLSESK